VTRWRFWIGVAAGFLLLLWLLSDILLPFVVAVDVVMAMCALLAGGSLLGFTGVLIAVPVAAVVGVVARHLMGRYHASSFYRGSPTG